jgi:hypothetical protein
VFRRSEQLLRETGRETSTAHVDTGHPLTVRTPVNKGSTAAALELEPWKRSRCIALELGLFQPRVLEVLHDDQLHPRH